MSGDVMMKSEEDTIEPNLVLSLSRTSGELTVSYLEDEGYPFRQITNLMRAGDLIRLEIDRLTQENLQVFTEALQSFGQEYRSAS